MSELRAKLAEPVVRLQQAPTPPNAPADLIYMTASYTVPAPWTAGNAGKRSGTQSVSFSTTYDFYVFLDNQQANANGPFQWLVVSAHVQAIRPGARERSFAWTVTRKLGGRTASR